MAKRLDYTPEPNATADYYAGIRAARAGEPRDGTKPRWWLRGYDYAAFAIDLDAFLDSRA